MRISYGVLTCLCVGLFAGWLKIGSGQGEATSAVSTSPHQPIKALIADSKEEMDSSLDVQGSADLRVHQNPIHHETKEGDLHQVFSMTPPSGAGFERHLNVVSPHLIQRPAPSGVVLEMKKQGEGIAGSPDIPVLVKMIPGIPDRDAQVAMSNTSFFDILGVDVLPVPTSFTEFTTNGMSSPRTKRIPNDEIYAADSFWPRDLIQVTEAWMGTQKWTRIEVRPVQYNAMTRTVRYHYRLAGQIRYLLEAETSDQGSPLVSQGLESNEGTDPLACPAENSGPVLPEMNGDPSDFALRRSGAEVDAVYKILVASNGMYKVTQPELAAAGIASTNLVGSEIRMFHRDVEIAIFTSTSGVMTSSDYLIFYGQEFTGLNSLTNVYWLGISGLGLRMEGRVSSPVVGATEIASHFQMLSYARNTLFLDSTGPKDEGWDHWRSDRLFTLQDGTVISNAVGSFVTDSVDLTGNAKVCITLHGSSGDPKLSLPGFDHSTSVNIGGQVVGTVQWDQRSGKFGSPISDAFEFPSTMLSDPSTSFEIHQLTPTGGRFADQANLESFRLIYPRILRVNGDRLHFVGQTGINNYNVDGLLSTSGLWILDLTDPTRPIRVTSFASEFTNVGWQIRFHHDSNVHPTYFINRELNFQNVSSIMKTPIRGLANRADLQADYILICPDDFQEQVYRLATNRFLKGESVVIAPIEDIYNEFSYGIKTAEAIRQFLGFAFHHWQKPEPQRVLLVGDGSYDPNGYLNPTTMDPADLIPCHMGGTPFTYASLDVWYTRVNGKDPMGKADILADMAIGRIPIRTEVALEQVVDKILAYEQIPFTDPFRKRGLLVTGNEIVGVPLGFNATADEIYNVMNSNAFVSVDQEYSPGATPANVLSSINQAQGLFVAAYIGHGAPEFWDNPPLLRTANTNDFNNIARLPIITATTCHNGYYCKPDLLPECLAEVFVELPDHGSIATIAGTALSQSTAASAIGIAFYETLLGGEVRTLGEAMMGGYLGGFEAGGTNSTAPELFFYQIFGDPGLIVNP